MYKHYQKNNRKWKKNNQGRNEKIVSVSVIICNGGNCCFAWPATLQKREVCPKASKRPVSKGRTTWSLKISLDPLHSHHLPVQHRMAILHTSYSPHGMKHYTCYATNNPNKSQSPTGPTLMLPSRTPTVGLREEARRKGESEREIGPICLKWEKEVDDANDRQICTWAKCGERKR